MTWRSSRCALALVFASLFAAGCHPSGERLSPAIAEALARNGIAVPIDDSPERPMSWQDLQFLAAALNEAESSRGVAVECITYPENHGSALGDGAGSSVHLIVECRSVRDRHEEGFQFRKFAEVLRQVEEDIRPAFRNPKAIAAKEVGFFHRTASLGVLPTASLRQEFVKDGKIDMTAAWAATLKAVRTAAECSLDAATEKSEDNRLFVKSNSRDVPTKEKGYVQTEWISLELKRRTERNGKEMEDVSLSVGITSEIWRRTLSAPRGVRIVVKRTLGEDGSWNKIDDVEDRVLRAVERALTEVRATLPDNVG